ncbi:hypothetical protein DXC34_17090 [Bacteroides stercoris]|jgi:hypothetical protein|uniref:NVEALA protein n=1 Tax=Bacteroides stercoris TaxID=46506 RepID=A0A3E4UK30_BACSE|nr:hypothetical protein DXC34_17090 [Bacteroides stercoris]
MSYEKVYIILSLILVQLERVYANQTSDAMSDLALANVDALAAYEGGGSPCGGPKDATGCRSENTINCKDTSGCQ